MPPTRDQIENALRTHFEAWNAGDRPRWIANWNPAAVMMDPVGGPEKRGLAAVEKSWDQAFQEGHAWRLEPIFMSICEDQAAVHVRNHGEMDGRSVVLDSIEIYWIDDDGRVARVQTYFSPPDGEALDPFFMQREG
jgi:ketosteroid isomerase-like protein